MNARLTLKIIQQGQTQKSFAIPPNAGQNGLALVLQASKGARYQITDALTFVSPEKLQIKRVGQDLLVALPGNDVGSPDLVIRGYFDVEGVSLSGLAPNGEPMVYATDTSLLATIKALGAAPVIADKLEPGQSTPVGLAKGSEGWFDSGWGLAALGGGGLLLAAAAGGGGGSGGSGTSAGLSKILAYKADGSKPEPTVPDFQNAGVTGVDSTNLPGVLSYISRTQLPLTTAASLQTLVDSFNKVQAEVNGSAADATPSSDPTADDYVNLMGSNSPASLSRKAGALALLNDRIKALNPAELDRYSKLNDLARVVDALSLLAESAPSTTGTASTTGNLSAAQVTALGVDVSATSLAAVSDAIRQASDDLSSLDTVAKLTALVRAYNTVLAEANGTGPDTTVANPTVADYAAINANIGAARTDAAALERLNAIVGNLASTGVDTVDEINKLAATLDKILTVAALASGTALSDVQKFSVDELRNLGLSGLGGTEIQNSALALKFSEAIRDKETGDVVKGSLTGMRLVEGVPTAADQTQLERLQTLLSFELIRGYKLDAQSATSTYVAPTASDWQGLGVFRALADGSAKFQALSATDASVLNDAVNTLRRPGTPAAEDLVSSVAKLKAIADSYLAILSEANGSTSNFASDGTTDLHPNPAWADYLRIGVTRQDASTTESASLTKLLNTLVAEKANAQVDTVRELQNLVGVAEELLALPGTSGSLGLDKLANNLTNPTSGSDGLGLRGVTSTNLADVNTAIRAASVAQVDTLGELQSLVSLVRIKRYADSSTDNSAPTADDWAALRLATAAADGEDLANDKAESLSAYNSAANAFTASTLTGVGSSATDTSQGSLQALVNSYNKVLSKANGSLTADTIDSSQITIADYAHIGLNLTALWTESLYGTPAVLANALTLLNDTVGRLTSTAVDSVDDLSALASSVSLLIRQADKANGVVTPQSGPTNTGPTGGFSNDLGLTLNDLNSLGLVTTALSNFNNDANDLNNVWAAIQNMDAATLTYQMIQNAITQYAT
jgi:hypothetical protein